MPPRWLVVRFQNNIFIINIINLGVKISIYKLGDCSCQENVDFSRLHKYIEFRINFESESVPLS